MSANPIIVRGASIGQVSAEVDDEFLFACFIDNEGKAVVADQSNPKMIILGSTGSGKTAILRKIGQENDSVHFIELSEVSLSYISNSDVVNFLMELDVPLDHFFQALWKHVIVSEYIKLRYNVSDEQRSQGFFGKLWDRFSADSKRRQALQYLDHWKNKFWVEFDETVRDLTKALEESVSANFAADLEKFKSDAGWGRKLSQERRSHLQQRLRKFVDADLLAELSRVITMLSDFDINRRKTHYIILDRLDDDWVSPAVKYQLIRSLVEAVKGIRKLSDMKVVVAMRSDIMEKVVHETRERGFQSEKYEDYIYRIFWTAEQLKQLVNKRINFLYRRRYTKDNVTFEDIFTDRVDKLKSFNYMLERTLYRPRDVISFVNICFDQASGKSSIGRAEVVKAERIYSENRRSALIDEWRSVFPGAEPTLAMLKGRRSSFNLYELNTSDFIDLAITLFFDDNKYNEDELTKLLENLTRYSTDDATPRLISAVFERLYLMGAVGIKTSAESSTQWFYKEQRRLDKNSFGLDAKAIIHPMLHSALNIRV